MKRRWALAASLFIMTSFICWAGETVVRDGEGRIRLVTGLEKSLPQGKQHASAILEFLVDQGSALGLEIDATSLTLYQTKSSLLGTHYYYRHTIDGIAVEESDVVVSVDKNGRIFKVNNQTAPKGRVLRQKAAAMLTQDDAMDVAWMSLGVAGPLKAMPENTLTYRFHEGVYQPIYRVSLYVEQPYGSWTIAVDAINGEVLEIRDTRWLRNPEGEKSEPNKEYAVLDRQTETARFIKEQSRVAPMDKNLKRAQGTGRVFDPDPVTTLENSGLRDSNSPDTFEAAYFIRDLKDITLNEGTGMYTLTGPWVRIVENSFPNNPPSSQASSFWDFRRGQNAFNEAVTYFHIDTNQRHIQALGFDNVQARSIRVDADAISGADQSWFIAPDLLEFGHGCVDDNEDADVIIHEYGHAVQYGINNFWSSSADQGAMGEGFADYWAGSHSISRPNGDKFEPFWMFHWDGHNNCWSGRVMDQFGAQYSSNRTYGAHQCLDNFCSVQSDELWSTPLFMALWQLYNQGFPREHIDQLIIQGHVGLGSGLRMPVVAESILQAAQMLYPNAPYAHVLRQNFARHNILTPVDEYTYIAAHIPPNRSSVDWQSQVLVSNPNGAAASVNYTVYEAGNDGSFTAVDAQTTTIDAHGMTAIVPAGSGQRWVYLQSDQPLAGNNVFQRDSGTAEGAEIAAVPLLSAGETASKLILPHVPADRAKFWSGAVILNPNDAVTNLSFKLYGLQGNNLDQLLNASAPTQLGAHEKWVGFLAEGPNGEAGLFNDAASSELVSYVEIQADNEIGAFQLYGYKSGAAAELATAGIVALPDEIRTRRPVRVSLTEANWAGFSILNPDDQPRNISIELYNKSGEMVAEAEVSIPAHGKKLGLNDATSGFSFPFAEASVISIADGSDLQHAIIRCETSIPVFELTGDSGNRTIDGAAVTGFATKTSFSNPRGVLEIFKAGHQGDIDIRTYRNGAETLEKITLDGGQSARLTLSDDIDQLEITGLLVSATVITADSEAGTFMVTNGKQVELDADGLE